METSKDIIVQGGRQLSGTITVNGAKNSVLKLMAAAILAPGKTHINNVPMISDVLMMGEVLSRLGVHTEFGPSDLTIDSSNITSYIAPVDLVQRLRASIAVLGPLLGRYHQAQVAVPGGCKIGERQLDIHFTALEALGMQYETDNEYIYAKAPAGLKGTQVDLRFPSVGATENLMMAAVLAKGTTLINNAAREPEITDLANYLTAMGAQIAGAGSPTIRIDGVDQLSPVAEYTTIGDRIESGTYLVAGALLGGPLTVEGIDPLYLATALDKLAAMGINVEKTGHSVTVKRTTQIESVDIQTLPFPGFPTDLQPQFMVLDSLASGQSMIAENIFENRFQHVDDLVSMGANIQTKGHFAYIAGVDRLFGNTVKSSDLRGGAALVLAGLAAEGETRVTVTEHIDRGYECFVEKLSAIGASIWRE
ncbi:MAG: UDP-N-acetylglucosamine 1-carboxyvinyltransferase [Coriobacteriales bacterium]|jgi:UDP-N-acetylglucosamine 1-carboxyvinyltransferase|nr:UDP-N-acetylglucosamine 1-carboxyvinyltransferase [Coriobacteriales bacterium]